MDPSDIPAELPISLEEACALSLECWRLKRLGELVKDTNAGSALRHAVRCIAKTLEKMGIEVVDFEGRTHDPGMVPEVVGVREDQALSEGEAVIDETIAPTVTWRGQVVTAGQIIVRRCVVSPRESTEVVE